MATLQQFSQSVNGFKEAFQRGSYTQCLTLLRALKIMMTGFPSLPPICENTATAQQENLLARDVLEHAVLLAIKLEDEDAFERNFHQLQTYYVDQRELLPPSDKEYMIIGLNLVRLLVQNCTAEFHTELELIPPEVHNTDISIKHAIQLEQWLMEGAYNKVVRCKQNIPASEYYSYFIDQLETTVRDEIASCCEKAYAQLKVSDTKELMMFRTDHEVLSYAQEMVEKQRVLQKEQLIYKDGDGMDAAAVAAAAAAAAAATMDQDVQKSIWQVVSGYITFQPESESGGKDVSSMDLIKKALIYAKELERIV